MDTHTAPSIFFRFGCNGKSERWIARAAAARRYISGTKRPKISSSTLNFESACVWGGNRDSPAAHQREYDSRGVHKFAFPIFPSAILLFCPAHTRTTRVLHLDQRVCSEQLDSDETFRRDSCHCIEIRLVYRFDLPPFKCTYKINTDSRRTWSGGGRIIQVWDCSRSSNHGEFFTPLLPEGVVSLNTLANINQEISAQIKKSFTNTQ